MRVQFDCRRGFAAASVTGFHRNAAHNLTWSAKALLIGKAFVAAEAAYLWVESEC